MRFSFFILLKSRTSLTKPVDPLWWRSNKQTHKLEFYLNTRETRYKKDAKKKFLSNSLSSFPLLFPLNSQFTARALTKLFNGHRLRNRQQLNEIMNYDNVLRSISASLRSAKSRPAINFNVRRTRSNCKTNRTRFETPCARTFHCCTPLYSLIRSVPNGKRAWNVYVYPIHRSWPSWQKGTARGIKSRR